MFLKDFLSDPVLKTADIISKWAFCPASVAGSKREHLFMILKFVQNVYSSLFNAEMVSCFHMLEILNNPFRIGKHF